MQLDVNGQQVEVVAVDEPLLWVLHDELELNGVRFGCGIGACGCCTVLADGVPIRSCQVTAREVEGRAVTTLEGLADGDRLHPVQQAFLDDPLQCGWCLPGHVLTAVALLADDPSPGSDEVDAAAVANLCRCGGYNTIRSNVAAAAEAISTATSTRDDA